MARRRFMSDGPVRSPKVQKHDRTANFAAWGAWRSLVFSPFNQNLKAEFAISHAS